MSRYVHGGGGSKSARARARLGGVVCPVCLRSADTQDKESRVEFCERWGHRDARGEPCPGFARHPVEA